MEIGVSSVAKVAWANEDPLKTEVFSVSGVALMTGVSSATTWAIEVPLTEKVS